MGNNLRLFLRMASEASRAHTDPCQGNGILFYKTLLFLVTWASRHHDMGGENCLRDKILWFRNFYRNVSDHAPWKKGFMWGVPPLHAIIAEILIIKRMFVTKSVLEPRANPQSKLKIFTAAGIIFLYRKGGGSFSAVSPLLLPAPCYAAQFSA